MSSNNGMVIECGPPDGRGVRTITAILGKKRHVDKLDPADSFKRSKLREKLIGAFELDDAGEVHEYLETKILAAADAPSTPLFKPVITMLDTVTPKKVEWLVPNKIAIGKNNLLSGEPGLGKSLCSLDFAARATSDKPFPDGTRSPFGPAGVVILTMEDDAADTMVPRLIAHGADLSRIALVQGITETDGDGTVIKGIDLATDIAAVRSAIEQVDNCRLVIVDTIADYVGQKVDTDKNRDVRSVMNPFAAMAAEMRVANLLLAHFRKGSGKAIHATMGSIAFVGQSRIAWAITRCPNNKKRRLMTCIKNNLADDTSGLAFTIESHGDDGSAVLAWEAEPVRMSADEAMEAAEKKRPGPKPTEREDAVTWLHAELLDGPRQAGVLLDDGESRGFSPTTVRRAFTQLECTRRKGGFNEGWLWSLPDDATEGTTNAPCTNNLAPSNVRESTGNKHTHTPSSASSREGTQLHVHGSADLDEFNEELRNCEGQTDIAW